MIKALAPLLGVIVLVGALPAGTSRPAAAQGTAWDGRGTEPDADTAKPEAPPKKRATTSDHSSPRPAGGQSTAKPYSSEWWARQKEIDDAESARLNRRMSICRAC